MRGTRLQLHWHRNPQYRFADAPDRMRDPVLGRNVAVLADLGWVFELQVFASQMKDAAEFVARYPDVMFVLAHAGMLDDTAPQTAAEWAAGLALLAEHDNVVTKLSGQGTFVHRVDQTLIDLVTDTSLRLFGSRRCMWGSNIPVEKIWTDLPSLVDAWTRSPSSYPADVRDDVFGGTARRVYRL